MIRIDASTCIGCAQCVSSCSVEALAMENGIAVLMDGCTNCGMCISSCPAGAISVDTQSTSDTRHKGILVVVQTQQNTAVDISLALCQKAQELSRGETPVYAALFDPNADAFSQKLIDSGADIVLACTDARIAEPDDGLYADTLTAIIQTYKPAIVLFGATSFGRSLAPRLAARLQTGLTADCTELSIDENGLLCQTRPAFGGNLMATIVTPNARPQMATVRPGIFPATPPQKTRTGQVITIDIPSDAKPLYRVLSNDKRPPARGLRDADIIVTAGRGIGGIKNMQLVYAFANRIGAMVAVTRPLVDAGFGEAHQQIGQTGTSVSPRILITLGVSGAIQHLAGIGGAKTIIAINSDPEAPVFCVADYAIVGDCVEILKNILG